MNSLISIECLSSTEVEWIHKWNFKKTQRKDPILHTIHCSLWVLWGKNPNFYVNEKKIVIYQRAECNQIRHELHNAM